MNANHIVAALTALRSGAEWSLVGEDYEGLIWLDKQPKPTEQEIESFVVPEPVPQSISDRQFFQQLAISGIITKDDALASNAAVIPLPLLAIISQMPEEQQFNAKMIISGATIYNRMDPLTLSIGAAYGWTSEQIDDFFRAASLL